MATDRFLFVATDQGYSDGRSLVHIFDISAPDGTMAAVARVETAGVVKDKFQMNLAGDTLSVVSERRWPTATFVETFSLASGAPSKMGSLKVVDGESLYASRFDSNRLYVVTFRRVDPLWIIDLSDASQPKITGELQVPGFSTYLCPLGDRLLAIGRENGTGSQTTVSLFDVHDSTKPALLKRVALGQQYSYSEANYDEKAFGVLPEIGLILVPFSEYSTNGTFQGVQTDRSRA